MPDVSFPKKIVAMAFRRDALPPSNDALSSSCDVLSSSRFTVSPSRDEESKHRVALAAPPSALLSSEQVQPSSPAMAPSFVEPASPPTLFSDSDVIYFLKIYVNFL